MSVCQGTGRWYELQDLHVRDILPQMITLTESYIQVRYGDRGVGSNPGGGLGFTAVCLAVSCDVRCCNLMSLLSVICGV